MKIINFFTTLTTLRQYTVWRKIHKSKSITVLLPHYKIDTGVQVLLANFINPISIKFLSTHSFRIRFEEKKNPKLIFKYTDKIPRHPHKCLFLYFYVV